MNCKTLPEALDFIVKRAGKDKLRDRSHVIACLTDLLPEQKAARKVLDTAFAMGVAEKFDEASGNAVNRQQMVLSQCCLHLCSDHGFQKELVEDVLWAYGIAMGFSIPEPLPKTATEQVPKPHSKSAPNALPKLVPAPQPPAPKQAPKLLPQPAPSLHSSNVQAISVNEITLQYLKNFAAAETQYQGKRLRLKGTVKSVERHYAYIVLEGRDRRGILPSYAFFAALQQMAPDQLKIGQTIEYMGTVEKFEHDTLFIIDCEFL